MSQQGSNCSCQENCTPWIIATSVVSFLLAGTVFGIFLWYFFRYRKILISIRMKTQTDEEDDPPIYDTFHNAQLEKLPPKPPALPARHRERESNNIAFESVKEDDQSIPIKEKKRKSKIGKKKKTLTDLQVISESTDVSLHRPRSDSMNNTFKTKKNGEKKKPKLMEDKFREKIPNISEFDKISDLDVSPHEEKKSTSLRINENGNMDLSMTKRDEEKQIEEIVGYLEDAIAEYSASAVGEGDSEEEISELRASYEGSNIDKDQITKSVDFFEVSRPNSPIPDKDIYKFSRDIKDSHLTSTQKPYKSRIFVYANPEQRHLKRSRSLATDSKGEPLHTIGETANPQNIQKDEFCRIDSEDTSLVIDYHNKIHNEESIDMTKPTSYDIETNTQHTKENSPIDNFVAKHYAYNEVLSGDFMESKFSSEQRHRSQTPGPSNVSPHHQEPMFVKRSNTLDRNTKYQGSMIPDNKAINNKDKDILHKAEEISSVSFNNRYSEENTHGNTVEDDSKHTVTKTHMANQQMSTKPKSLEIERIINTSEQKEDETNVSEATSNGRKDDNNPERQDKKDNNNENNLSTLLKMKTVQSVLSGSRVEKIDTSSTLSTQKPGQTLFDMPINMKLSKPDPSGKVTGSISVPDRIHIPKRAMTPDPIAIEDRGLVYNQHFASNVRRSRSLNIRDKMKDTERILPTLKKIEPVKEESRVIYKYNKMADNYESKVSTVNQETDFNEKANVKLTAAKLRTARRLLKDDKNNYFNDSLLEESDFDTNSMTLRGVQGSGVIAPKPTTGSILFQNKNPVKPANYLDSHRLEEQMANSSKDILQSDVVMPIEKAFVREEPTSENLSSRQKNKILIGPIRSVHNNGMNKPTAGMKQDIVHRSRSVQERPSTLLNGGQMPFIEEENRRKRRHSTLTTPIQNITATPKKGILKRPERTMSERSSSIDVIPLSQFVSSATSNKRLDSTKTSSYLRHDYQTTNPLDRSIAFAENDVLIGGQGSRDSVVQRSLSYSSKIQRPPTPAVNMMGRRRRNNSLLDKRDWRLSSTKF